MPCRHPVYDWIDLLVSTFDSLSRPQATALALYSFGAIMAKRCGLNSVVAAVAAALDSKLTTVRSRLQEFYQPAKVKSGTHRRQLDVAACFRSLLAWVLRGWPVQRLALALDATGLGARFTVLSISVVYRGSAIPVAWKILRANVRHPWRDEWLRLLETFRPWVPRDWTVIVMTDRGLYARGLFQAVVDLGWHPLMRITHGSKFRKSGSRSDLAVTSLVTKPGRRWQGRGLAFPRRPDRRLACTLLACWEEGHEEPWFLVTDLAPEHAEALWYGMRAWTEQGFRLLKTGGWQWQATRMLDPERAERLWLVVAVATCFVLKVGGEAEADDTPVETIPECGSVASARGSTASHPRPSWREGRRQEELKSSRRKERTPERRQSGTRVRWISVFLRGLSELVNYLMTHHRIPEPHWKVEPWLELRGTAHEPPTPVPRNPSL